jgi:hypothetical protein
LLRPADRARPVVFHVKHSALRIHPSAMSFVYHALPSTDVDPREQESFLDDRN